MAKAKCRFPTLSANSKERTFETAEEKDLSKTLKHSRLQTLEEILYSLDDKNSGHIQQSNQGMETNNHGKDSVIDIAVPEAVKDDIVGSSGANQHIYDETRPKTFKNKSKHSNLLVEQDSESDVAKVPRSRLKDPAVLDLDAFLNDDLDSDIGETASIDDLQTRRRLLDYQLQQRIEQYYLEDLDLDSLNAEDFATDFQILGSRNFLPAKPDFPQSVESEEECWICFEVLIIQKRWCCDFPVCHSCMDRYLEVKVNQGVVKISCINGGCSSYIHREEIYSRLSLEMKEKFCRFLVNANQDPNIKTCPKCSHVYNATKLGLDDRQKFGELVVCPECKLEWCFCCHAPWHLGVKCKDFQKGDKLVKHWAKEQHYGVNNAQKCPKCKIFIERKGGCDHMTCIRCNTGFCYRCGDRYRDLKFFGNHLSRYSIVGCKYNYLPNHPVARRLCRGSVFGAELLGGVALLGLGIAAAGLLLGASVVILPAFGGYKYHKRRKFRRILKQEEELFRMRTKNAMVELQRERAVLERYTEKLHQQTGLTDGDIGSVHVGIQTDNSQKVEVTVHSPSTANSSTNGEKTVDSKICMNISDNKGQVSVTTAEITHNASKGEGSEAEVVLHVRTTYTGSSNKDGTVEGNTPLQIDNDKDGPTNNDNDGLKDRDYDSNMKQSEHYSVPDTTPVTDSSSSDSLKSSQPYSKHNRTASLPVKYDSLKNKDGVKFIVGKQSLRHSERSRKHTKTKDLKSSESDSQNTVTSPADHNEGEALQKNNDEKASDDPEENTENESLSQSGCFLKLFSRKFNTLQSQLGKEREKNSLTRSLSEPIDYTNCPDLVSCILASEMKNIDNKEEMKEGREPAMVQQAEGIVAKETCSTSF